MRDRLRQLCEQFIKEHEISCVESIYQNDSIAEASLEFIESVCEIIGYVDTDK